MKPLDRSTVTNEIHRGPHARVAAGETDLAYWRFGRGPDVVLVHGWPLHSATWRALVPLLAERFTLHLFDLPGVGHSPALPGGRATLETHAAALRRAIDTLGLASYAFVSHDSGAVITRLVAANDRRVRGVVMGNTEIPNHHAWQVQGYVWATKIPGLAPALMRAMRFGIIRRAPFAFGGCFADPLFADGEFGEIFVRPLVASRAIIDGHLALVRGLDFDVIHGLDEVHARIEAPALLVWGTDDPFFPIEKARATLAQFARGARLVEIPGKLFAHEEQPEAFAEHAAPFLSHGFEATSPDARAATTSS